MGTYIAVRVAIYGMPHTLLTGGTGTLGKALRPRLQKAGRSVRATSRSPPDDDDDDIEWVEMDLADGTGIEAALEDVDVVIHTASAPQGDSEAVDVAGTERLLEAADDAGISNFLYVSIVGIDNIPFSYYQHKLKAEQLVEESDVSSTIIRSTQFHQFLDEMLSPLRWLPLWPMPTNLKLQPIDVRKVADTITEHATTKASGRVPDLGGPDVLTLGEILQSYQSARDFWRPVVRLPIPGGTTSAFRAGEATCPDRTVGTMSWDAWLEEQYSSEGSAAASPSAAQS